MTFIEGRAVRSSDVVVKTTVIKMTSSATRSARRADKVGNVENELDEVVEFGERDIKI